MVIIAKSDSACSGDHGDGDQSIGGRLGDGDQQRELARPTRPDRVLPPNLAGALGERDSLEIHKQKHKFKHQDKGPGHVQS